jgi:hypothetical protein
LHSFGPTFSPLRPVTLDFLAQVVGVVNVQPPVPLVFVVSTLVVADSVPAPAPESQAPQSDPSSAPASKLTPVLASITDPRSETDSNTVIDYASTAHPRPNVSAPHPSSSGL